MDELTCLLMDAAKLLKSGLTKSLKPYNVTCRQALVLRAVESESLSAKAIGEVCAMDKATLSVILDKLIQNNYISCKKNKDDKRENVYAATKEGIDVLPYINTVESAYLLNLKEALPDDEYEKTISSLTKIMDLLK